MALRILWLLVAASLLAVSAIAASSPGKPSLQFVSRGKSNRLIVFVDGLTAEPEKTFRWGQGVPSWPELMAGDTSLEKKQLPLSRYDIAHLTFSGVPEGQRSIPQLATKALVELKEKSVYQSYESISFVAYSAGGLVLKSMLIQASITGSQEIAAKTKTVFLLSVPSQGKAASDFLTTLKNKASLLTNFSGSDVPTFLQGLEALWSEFLSSRGPTRNLKIYCLHETEATFGTPVKPGQYTAEGCDESGQQGGTDHTTIAKPGSRDAGAYRWVRNSLASYFSRFPSDPGKPKTGEAVAAIVEAPPQPETPPALPEPAPVAPAPAPSTAKLPEAAKLPEPSLVPAPAEDPPATGATTPLVEPAPGPAKVAQVEPKDVSRPATATTMTPVPASPPPRVTLARPAPAPAPVSPQVAQGSSALAARKASPRSSAPMRVTRPDLSAALQRPDRALPTSPRRPVARAPLPDLQVTPARAGNWTFSLKGLDCNLPVQLWVVQVSGQQIRSEDWRARIKSDGRFATERHTACATETVRGSISGTKGSGWYLYADPCKATYCRVKFKMTWRLPESAWRKK